MTRSCLLALFALIILAGCSGHVSQDEGVPAMKLTSTAFAEGGMIPDQYSYENKNLSPPLAWSDVPANAKSFALICDDPDAPRPVPWVHWVIFNLPADRHELPEGVKADKTVLGGAKQGTSDYKKVGYGGPAPPSGTHRYYFKLYALDTLLDLKEGATKQELEAAMKGHILAKGELMGKFAARK